MQEDGSQQHKHQRNFSGGSIESAGSTGSAGSAGSGVTSGGTAGGGTAGGGTARGNGTDAFTAAAMAAMEPYVSSLFRFVYALFPHETLTFLQAECSANPYLTSVLERRFHWMRFHPALLQPQPEQLNNKKWASHSPEELLGFADELAIRSSSSSTSSSSSRASSSRVSEFKPLLGVAAQHLRQASTISTGSTTSTTLVFSGSATNAVIVIA